MTRATEISNGLRLLLSGLIDYAGMFPPANLALEPALDNYFRYVEGPDAWMLSTFILPVDRLVDAARLIEARLHRGPIRIAVLGKGGPDWSSFFSGLDAEIDRIDEFRHRLGRRIEIAAFETRLPGAELDFQIRADALVAEAAERLARAELGPFFEVPAAERWQTRVEHTLDALASISAALPARFKLRTGGVTADAIPSTETIAWVLSTVSERDLKLKFTAGLHHPLRRFREEVGTQMHGFINVFTAAVLAKVHQLPASELNTVLAEEDPRRFRFDDLGIAWTGLAAAAEDVARLRGSFAVSFGSCSFDEPREDLISIGWM